MLFMALTILRLADFVRAADAVGADSDLTGWFTHPGDERFVDGVFHTFLNRAPDDTGHASFGARSRVPSTS
jgi:hypothetical protein